MTESQRWADIIAIVRAIEKDDEYSEVMKKYAHSINGDLLIDYSLVTSMVLFIDTLMTAIADYLAMDPEELDNFILMEKFKHELFGDD